MRTEGFAPRSSKPAYGAAPPESRPKSALANLPKNAGKRDDFVYGVHPVTAALQNPARIKKLLMFTPQKQKLFQDYVRDHNVPARTVTNKELDEIMGENVTHQGVALFTSHLRVGAETELRSAKGILVMLDDITDTHNIGAIIRSCAAFGASGVILQEKNSPQLNGVIAKTSAGAIETMPMYRVENLSRTVTTLRRLDFEIVALTADGDTELTRFQPKGKNILLILGSEAEGVREASVGKADVTLRIPIDPGTESLNVSNAAAVTLYECRRGQLNKSRESELKNSIL